MKINKSLIKDEDQNHYVLQIVNDYHRYIRIMVSNNKSANRTFMI